ncbi:MAG: efflux RND transporter periplasmic adaptor subunit [Candidatus Omnitrophica bacterium]|nr:efflux RND transporter periplasmic adaptor subunit [Candidatus Omnitrophota bacterium]
MRLHFRFPKLTRRRMVIGALGVAVLFIGFIGVRLIWPHNQTARQGKEKAVYYCPMHPTMTSERPADCPICSMKMVKREKKILYWTDPMIPGYKSDKPGKSPMGMDLIPVYEEGGPPTGGEMAPEGYAAVEITPQKQQLIGVKTTPAARRRIHKTVRTVGQIAYDPELYQAEAEYLKGLRAWEDAKGVNTPGVAERSQELVEAARIRLRILGLSESFIGEIAAWEGPDKSLLLSDEKGRVWLYAPIYEFELPFVRAGQTIRMEAGILPGKTLEGTIRSIDPVLDPMTRTARVRALLTDPKKILRPQMYVNASIEVDLGEVIAVPQEAIFDTGTRRILFVAREEGMFEPREVVVGARADGFTEVKQGVAEGERVVVSGNFLIDSESRLKSALGAMAPSTFAMEGAAGGQSKPAESKTGDEATMKEHPGGHPHGR